MQILNKNIVFLIVFIFSNYSFSDEVSNFKIEGIGLGDNLLEHFSKKQIDSNTVYDYYNSDKFVEVEIYDNKTFSNYNNIQVSIKSDNYIVYAIAGFEFYEKDLHECFKKVDNVADQLKNLLPNAQKEENYKAHEADPAGESIVKEITFWSDTGDVVASQCYDWSDSLTKNKGWTDNFNVTVYSSEFVEFLTSQAY
tara:strand:+ start:92 stop:679 length:588 start_codon:yes stop_codon:yes gene_type:complete